MDVFVVTKETSLGGEMFTEILGVYKTEQAAKQGIWIDREINGTDLYAYDTVRRDVED